MRLIGLSGFKTSGKDTAALFIKELTPEPVLRIAFADKLKEMAARAIGISPPNDPLAAMNDCKEEWKFKILVPGMDPDLWFTGREYLQWFGQGAREIFGDTFWIDQILPLPQKDGRQKGWDYQELIDLYPNVKLLVVTDVRYANEAQRILDLGGKVIEIVRPGIESDGHASETPLPRELVTKTIVNDGTLNEFRHNVEFAI